MARDNNVLKKGADEGGRGRGGVLLWIDWGSEEYSAVKGVGGGGGGGEGPVQ